MPGHEACRVMGLREGWRLDGAAVFLYEGQACRLDYVIACDAQRCTRSALVKGWAGKRMLDIRILRDGAGRWQYNGQACEDVTGCMDIDLNFSPSTNLLPIRRCNLAVGITASVRAAWLQFPSLTLEALEQNYTRLGEQRYRYESGDGQFVVEMAVDPMGLAITYGQLWSRQIVHPAVEDSLT